jgi:hypothetical protein
MTGVIRIVYSVNVVKPTASSRREVDTDMVVGNRPLLELIKRS